MLFWSGTSLNEALIVDSEWNCLPWVALKVDAKQALAQVQVILSNQPLKLKWFVFIRSWTLKLVVCVIVLGALFLFLSHRIAIRINHASLLRQRWLLPELKAVLDCHLCVLHQNWSFCLVLRIRRGQVSLNICHPTIVIWRFKCPITAWRCGVTWIIQASLS